MSTTVTLPGSAGPVRDAAIARWRAGAALMADNAAAAALGARVAAEAPSPSTTAELEEEAIGDFRPGDVAIRCHGSRRRAAKAGAPAGSGSRPRPS